MKSKITIFFLCLLVSGCAGVNQMAIKKETKTIDTSAKSILLMTITLSRPENSRYIPHPLLVRFEKTNLKGELEKVAFQTDSEAGKTESDLSNKYFMRMALEPGEYKLHTIFGNANAFPFNGFFDVPLLMKISVPSNSIVYLGGVDALLRPRKENEFRAGSVVPLIDQAATGVSGGTFDVLIKDASDADISLFQSKFPSLSGQDIKKAILPAWERERAQAWWQNNGVDK